MINIRCAVRSAAPNHWLGTTNLVGTTALVELLGTLFPLNDLVLERTLYIDALDPPPVKCPEAETTIIVATTPTLVGNPDEPMADEPARTPLESLLHQQFAPLFIYLNDTSYALDEPLHGSSAFLDPRKGDVTFGVYRSLRFFQQFRLLGGRCFRSFEDNTLSSFPVFLLITECHSDVADYHVSVFGFSDLASLIFCHKLRNGLWLELGIDLRSPRFILAEIESQAANPFPPIPRDMSIVQDWRCTILLDTPLTPKRKRPARVQ